MLSTDEQIKGRRILITGGLGFIGFNAVKFFAPDNQVLVIDDCSRIDSINLIEQVEQCGAQFKRIDISHQKPLKEAWDAFQPQIVLHLAGQVAVTLSMANPMRDFASNAAGTLNLLELARRQAHKPTFIFSSTNKVYGDIKTPVSLVNGRYVLEGATGFDEALPLSFKTPYGCSKGAADQYVLDYYTSFGVPSVVLRQSCIYGPHQYGIEDQGWVAWFTYCALSGREVTMYGDGAQVRDVLYIDDLLAVFVKAINRIGQAQGEAFNIGGGSDKTLSLNELVSRLEGHLACPIKIKRAAWRPGDQRVFICDINKARRLLDWQPKVNVGDGLIKLVDWMRLNQSALTRVFEAGNHISARVDVSIVIPAHNEEGALPKVLDELAQLIDQSSYRLEVIVVDDRSSDGTSAVARQYPFVRLVSSHHPPGKGGALRSGFEAAKGVYLAMMDADYSHKAVDLLAMIEEVRHHQGLVVASRITGGSDEYTRVRAFGNIVLTWFFGFIHGRYLSDALNGFKIFHRDVFNKFVYTSDAYEIEIELLVNTLRLKRPITEISSHERARVAGKAKSSVIRHGTLFASRILYERFRRVIRRDVK